MPQIAIVAVVVAIVAGGGGYWIGTRTTSLPAAPVAGKCIPSDDAAALEKAKRDNADAFRNPGIGTQANGRP